jgi:hypothetical protein
MAAIKPDLFVRKSMGHSCGELGTVKLGRLFQSLVKGSARFSKAWKDRKVRFPRPRTHITSAPPKEDGYTYRLLTLTTPDRRPVHEARVYAVD